MKNVFISQPMRNRDADEIIAEREKLMNYARQLLGGDVREINPFFKLDIQSGNQPLRMLGVNIELMAEADVAIFANGWSVARGCRIENECARQYGIKVIDLED